MYPDRVSSCKVRDENGTELLKEDIVVLPSYKDDPLQEITSAAILFVNSDLRKQYDELHSETEKAKDTLLKALKKQSKCKTVESKCPRLSQIQKISFFTALDYVNKEIHRSEDAPYADLPYDVVFDEEGSVRPGRT